MNKVSFGGIYLHSYPTRQVARTVYGKIADNKNIFRALGCNVMQDVEALPLPGSGKQLIVCTGKDAADFIQVIDKPFGSFANAKNALIPFVIKAKKIIHN